MSPKALVERFYCNLWNQADESVAWEILDKDFRFRASLGPELNGPGEFINYLRAIHTALGNYRCIIEDLIIMDNRVAAKMQFKGQHQAAFFGVGATGREISWTGAAFFHIHGEQIVELWVLGDIDYVKQQLGIETSASFSSP